MILMVQKGFVRISLELYEKIENHSCLLALQSKIIILKAEPEHWSHTMMLLCLSEQFRMLSHGDLVPFYELIVSKNADETFDFKFTETPEISRHANNVEYTPQK